MNFGRGKVSEKSGNFVSDFEWAPWLSNQTSRCICKCIRISIKTFVLSIFKWPLKTGFTVIELETSVKIFVSQQFRSLYLSHQTFRP